MNRRGFLGMLAAAIADPERLLWTPGKKLISIPSPSLPPAPTQFGIDFVVTDAELKLANFEMQYITPAIKAIADRIDREMCNPRFLPLPLPKGADSAYMRDNFRVVHLFDPVKGRTIYRVDALVVPKCNDYTLEIA